MERGFALSFALYSAWLGFSIGSELRHQKRIEKKRAKFFRHPHFKIKRDLTVDEKQKEVCMKFDIKLSFYATLMLLAATPGQEAGAQVAEALETAAKVQSVWCERTREYLQLCQSGYNQVKGLAEEYQQSTDEKRKEILKNRAITSRNSNYLRNKATYERHGSKTSQYACGAHTGLLWECYVNYTDVFEEIDLQLPRVHKSN